MLMMAGPFVSFWLVHLAMNLVCSDASCARLRDESHMPINRKQAARTSNLLFIIKPPSPRESTSLSRGILRENILAGRNVIPLESRIRFNVEPGSSDLIVPEVPRVAGNASIGRQTHTE